MLSIIIPSRAIGDELPVVLRSIQSQNDTDWEVIVVGPIGGLGSYRFGNPDRIRLLNVDTDRCTARNLGAAQARGDVLLFLDDDMELNPLVVGECLKAIQSHDALCIREVTIGNGYWTKARALERDATFGSGQLEYARCFSAMAFSRLGGYDPALSGLEDPDLHFRFLAANLNLGWVTSPIYHHEEHLSLLAYLKKRAIYAAADKAFSEKHPEAWSRISSFKFRWSRICSHYSGKWTPDLIVLVPGFIIVRALEFGIRVFARERSSYG